MSAIQGHFLGYPRNARMMTWFISSSTRRVAGERKTILIDCLRSRPTSWGPPHHKRAAFWIVALTMRPVFRLTVSPLITFHIKMVVNADVVHKRTDHSWTMSVGQIEGRRRPLASWFKSLLAPSLEYESTERKIDRIVPGRCHRSTKLHREPQ